MYTFQQKKVISRKIADISYIEKYRQLLKSVRSPAAGRKMLDRQQLAVSLVYELLAYYSEAEILRIAVDSPAASAEGTMNDDAGKTVKKKSRNLNSILTSAGGRWTTLLSGLRTAFSRTGSTSGAGSGILRKTLKVPRKWMPPFLRR